MSFQVRSLMTPDGRQLRTALWPLKDPHKRRGICVLLNGHTEFLEKYEEVAGELNERGLEVASLDRVVATNGFERLRPTNECPNTLPDVAATFVRVGPLRVQVHGSCLARYQHVYNALAHAVRLKF